MALERKPIATFKENTPGLFLKLKPYVEKYLVKDAYDWKRSFGRPTRSIKIELNFEEFDADAINFEDSWVLCARPIIHTYWIDCDVETYKSNVKDEIGDWLSILKEKDINNWLIVVIVNTDSRVKSKLLRNSTYDKIKSDFCGKQVDRCIMLCEPLKNDARSIESWNGVGARLRMLTVESYNRLMDKFEENMRMQRERRVEMEWNFCSYFLLQEELAFMYEMLGLFQDALIQYDELDALFTQFVLNSSIAEPAPWLEEMSCNQATRWDGVCLCRPLDLLKQNSIATNKCSLLDLRSYLFSRQSYLLLRMSQLTELIQRAVPFMLNFIKESKLLQLDLPNGAIDCWIFLSCMEILKVCCLDGKFQKLDTDESQIISIHSSGLWDLAKSKMCNLGKICGLMVGADVQPSSDHLMVVIDLLPGLVHTAGDSSHLNRLLEALSSKNSFTQYYLELLEQCICSFKLVGRPRCAKFVGKELAEFYLLIEDYEKAELNLVDALKTYKLEGWEMLANHTRLKIALCQKKLNQLYKYCRTCMYISSSTSMNLETRKRFLMELIDISKKREDGSESKIQQFQFRCSPSFVVSVTPSSSSSSSQQQSPPPPLATSSSSSPPPLLPQSLASLVPPPCMSIKLMLDDIRVDDVVDYQVNVLSNFPCEVSMRSIQIHFLSLGKRAVSLKNCSSDPNTKMSAFRSPSITSDFISLSRKSSLDPSNASSPNSTPQKNLPHHPLQPDHLRHTSGQSGKFRPRQPSILGGFELINRVAETIAINFQPVNIKETVHYFEDGDEDEDDEGGGGANDGGGVDGMSRGYNRHDNGNRANKVPMFSALVCRSPLQRLGSLPIKPDKELLTPPSSSLLSSSSSSSHRRDYVIFNITGNDEGSVVLKSGLNSLVIPGQFPNTGTYQATHVTMRINERLEFIQSLSHMDSFIHVHPRVIHSQIIPADGELMAGFKQKLNFTIPLYNDINIINNNNNNTTKSNNINNNNNNESINNNNSSPNNHNNKEPTTNNNNNNNTNLLNSLKLILPPGLLLLNNKSTDDDDSNNNNNNHKMWIKDSTITTTTTTNTNNGALIEHAIESSPPPSSSSSSSPPTSSSSSSSSIYKLSNQAKSSLSLRGGGGVGGGGGGVGGGGMVEMFLMSFIDCWVDNQSFNHQVIIKCDGYDDDVHELIFKNPFTISHHVLTAVEKKYLQIIVESHHKEPVDIFNWKLDDTTDNQSPTNQLPTNQPPTDHPSTNQPPTDHPSTKQPTFQSLNGLSSTNRLVIHPHKNASLVWLISNEAVQSTHRSTLSINLSFDYKQSSSTTTSSSSSTSTISNFKLDKGSGGDDDDDVRTLTCSFKLNDIRTHYITTMTFEKDDVIVNHWVPLQLIIKQLIRNHHRGDDDDDNHTHHHHHHHHLHYMVTCDCGGGDDVDDGGGRDDETPPWLLSGDVKGIVDFQSEKFELSLLCKPLRDVNLKIPKVMLFHCSNQHKANRIELDNDWKEIQTTDHRADNEDADNDEDDDDEDDDDDNLSHKVSFEVEINDEEDENESIDNDLNSNPLNAVIKTSIRKKSLMTPINPCWVYDNSKIKMIPVQSFNKPQIFQFDRWRPPKLVASETRNTWL